MSAKGTPKFIMQRASAMMLLPLGAWFLISLISHVGDTHTQMKAWLGSPVNAILMALFVCTGAFHMRIGMSEIIEDYIHGGLKPVLLLANWAFAIAVGVLAAYSVLSLAFG